ncbi:MAG: hypothetical protein ABEI75_03090 [Halobaculum sp.]
MGTVERLRDPEVVGYALFVAAVSPALLAALHGQPAAKQPLLVARGETLADFQTVVSVGTVIAVTLRTGPLGFVGSVLEFAGTSSYLLGGTGVAYAAVGFLLVFTGAITWTYSLRRYVFPRRVNDFVDEQLDEEDEERDPTTVER